MRLGVGLVGAARGAKQRLQAGRLERRGRGRGGSCRSRSRARCCLRQTPRAARACRRTAASCPRARGNACGSCADELRVALGRQLGHRDAQRIVQAEADDVARRARASGTGRPDVARRLRMQSAIVAGGVDDRAVPVEHQQPVAHGRLSMNACISAGSGDSSFMRLAGQRMAEGELRRVQQQRAACSSRLSAKSPYLSSPTTGWPACARCTRIWCVRPVSSRTSSRLSCAAALEDLDPGHARPCRRPAPLTRRSPGAGDILVQRSRSSSVSCRARP